MSHDDSLVAIGTELGSVELYSFRTLVRGRREEKTSAPKLPDINQLQRSPSAAFIKCYHTKLNGVLLARFTWRNFLTTVGCVEKLFN